MRIIKNFFRKPFAFAMVFAVLLMSLNVYVLLKTYVISSVQAYVEDSSDTTSVKSSISDDSGGEYSDGSDESGSDDVSDTSETSEVTITDTSYSDGNIQITIETIRQNDTTIYVADIQLSDAKYLKTALANNAFGTNITQKTSEMAEQNNAIFAVNGDYYGANTKGYVIKNGVIYRSTVRSDSEYDDLVIYEDGSFGIINETEVTAQELLDSGVVNLFAFGPTLVQNGSIAVSANDEVGKAKSDNPRTAIGIVDDLHYVIVVSDGRTSESEGLSLYQLATVMASYGCITAYNLDGGGSSTMYFNGEIINNPTTNGKKISEREVSDIVYIGY